MHEYLNPTLLSSPMLPNSFRFLYRSVDRAIAKDLGLSNFDLTDRLITVRAINNGSLARDPEVYANPAAEQCCGLSRELEKRKAILPNDGEFMRQLSGRRRTYDDKNRVTLKGRARSKPLTLDSNMCLRLDVTLS